MVQKVFWTIRRNRGSSEKSSEVVSSLSPIIHCLCNLSYWCVWKLQRWEEPRLWPPKFLGGQSISRHRRSASASLSQQRPNLFGKQTPLLSLVSGGLLRVRRRLFSFWSRDSPEGTGGLMWLIWLFVMWRWRVYSGSVLDSSLFISIVAMVLSNWVADRCWTRLNEIVMSESYTDWALV